MIDKVTTTALATPIHNSVPLESDMNPKPEASRKDDAASTPWWRVGMVWLVLSGPAIVVVAGITTAVIAIRGADPIVTAEEVAQRQAGNPQAYMPAMQARNHSATAGR
jgi:uncharacterized protein